MVGHLKETNKDRNNNFVIYRISQKMPFYQQLIDRTLKDSSIETILKFFEGASYEFFKKDSVLMKEDEQDASKAYVVLRGRIAILRKRKQNRI